jgi:hypothetical protein
MLLVLLSLLPDQIVEYSAQLPADTCRSTYGLPQRASKLLEGGRITGAPHVGADSRSLGVADHLVCSALDCQPNVRVELLQSIVQDVRFSVALGN